MRRPLLLICSVVLLTGVAQAEPVSQLHDALNLSHSQEDAWRTFQTSAANSDEPRIRSQQTAAMLPTLPTPRRLAMIHAGMQADLADFDRSAQAVTAFYSVLTPDQQRIFDEQTAGPPRGQQQQQQPQRH
jgi:hypothetical protein